MAESEDFFAAQAQYQSPPDSDSGAQSVPTTDSGDEGDMEEDVELKGRDPWPYLSEFFTFVKSYAAIQNKKKGEQTIEYKCRLCTPGKTIKVATSSRFALNRHIRTTHPSSREAFETLLADNVKKRGRPTVSSSSSQELEKQQSINTFLGRPSLSGNVSQAKVDELILNFVVGTAQAFHIVESQHFINMIKTLQPRREIMSRRVLVERIEKKVEVMKTAIKSQLEEATHITATTDIWTYGRRSYLGMTAHFLTPMLDRKSFVIACRRLRGSHTAELVGRAIVEVLQEWGISHKMVGITTDNATNFVKAFRLYRMEDQMQETQLLQTQEEGQENDSDEEEYTRTASVSIGDLLEDNNLDMATLELPDHYRCAAHTLNLVATRDAEKARDQLYMRLHRQVFAKLSAVWSLYNKSPIFFEKVTEKFSRGMVTPTPTRWNSVYDSVVRIREMYEEDSNALATVFAVKVRPLQQEEMKFLTDWLTVMKPLAMALDHLQGEDTLYMGHLLPAISHLKSLMDEATEKVGKGTCNSLLNAVKDGIKARFSQCFEDRRMLVATAYHPLFKIHDLEGATKELAHKYLVEEAEKIEGPTSSQPADVGNSRIGFFGKRPRKIDSAEQEVARFLADQCEDVESVLLYRRLKMVFLQTNTTLPSSAPAERLFSRARHVFRRQRQKMTDKHFESQLLLNANNM